MTQSNEALAQGYVLLTLCLALRPDGTMTLARLTSGRNYNYR